MYIKKLIKYKLNRSFHQLWTGNIIVILNLFFKDILVSVNFVHVNVLQEEAEFLSSLGSHRRSNTHSKASSGSESDGGSHITSRVSGKRERERDSSLSWMGALSSWVGWVERRDWDFSLSLTGAREREGERDSSLSLTGAHTSWVGWVGRERRRKEERDSSLCLMGALTSYVEWMERRDRCFQHNLLTDPIV